MSTIKEIKFTIKWIFEFHLENMYKKFAKSGKIMYNIRKESDVSETIHQ